MKFCRIRVLVHSVVSTKYFEMFVMGVICFSSIALSAEDPVDDDAPRNKILQYMDYCFTGVFAFEMCLKVKRKKKDQPLFFNFD